MFLLTFHKHFLPSYQSVTASKGCISRDHTHANLKQNEADERHHCEAWEGGAGAMITSRQPSAACSLQPAAVNKSAWAPPSDRAFPTLPHITLSQNSLLLAAAFNFTRVGQSKCFSILWSTDTYGPCSDLVLCRPSTASGRAGKYGQRETDTAPGANHSYWGEGLVMTAIRTGLHWAAECGINQIVRVQSYQHGVLKLTVLVNILTRYTGLALEFHLLCI